MNADALPFTRYRPIIDNWRAFQEAILRPLPITIWANPLKTTPAQLSRLLIEGGAPHEPLDWYPGAFRLPPETNIGLRWEYMAGLFHVQEEVSLLPVWFLGAQPGQRVLDLCAAPGNKTAQLAVQMQNRGTIVANDRNFGRMRAARHTFERLGLINITTTTADGANLPGEIGRFHHVLVDAPCTCEGTCRKDPALLHEPAAWEKVVGLQTALLRKGVQLCRPDGRIVYSTCTFAPEENERVVDAILREVGDGWQVTPLSPPPGFTASPGLTAWQGETFHPSLRHALRVWPHQNDTGGFFVAVLEKNHRAESAEPAEESDLSAPPRLRVTEERQPWLSLVAQRFGIDTAVFDHARIFRGGKRKLYLVNDDHHALPGLAADAMGMAFMRISGRYPKMSTAASMIFGPHATRNVIEVSAAETAAYLSRQTFPITADRLHNCTGGYVLLHHRGVWLGQGVLYLDDEGNGRVASQFPKGWSRQNVLF